MAAFGSNADIVSNQSQNSASNASQEASYGSPISRPAPTRVLGGRRRADARGFVLSDHAAGDSFSDTKLPNGLRLIVAEDHVAPVSSSAVVYSVGSRDVRACRTGFAHLFAHMMLKGSENVWPGEHFYTNGHVGAGDAAGGLVMREPPVEKAENRCDINLRAPRANPRSFWGG